MPGTRAAALLLLLVSPTLRMGAEQLVTRMFSTLDGLADNIRLGDILQDSRGFIWIATQGGVSRFDGQQFQNFSVQDGLGYPLVNRICETRGGEIWLATNGSGAARYDPLGPPGRRFVSYATGSTQESNAVNSIKEDAAGAIWAATDAGVYRLAKGSSQFRLEFVPPPIPSSPITQDFSDVLPAVVFRIHDDGTGFDPERTADGHGIASMRSRAERLGGTLVIQSGRGRGTSVEFRAPI